MRNLPINKLKEFLLIIQLGQYCGQCYVVLISKFLNKVKDQIGNKSSDFHNFTSENRSVQITTLKVKTHFNVVNLYKKCCVATDKQTVTARNKQDPKFT